MKSRESTFNPLDFQWCNKKCVKYFYFHILRINKYGA